MNPAPIPWQHILIIAIAEQVIAMLTSACHFETWGFSSTGNILREQAQYHAEHAFRIAATP